MRSLKSKREGNIHGCSGLAGGAQGAGADPQEAALPPLLLGGDEPARQQHGRRHHLRPQPPGRQVPQLPTPPEKGIRRSSGSLYKDGAGLLEI